MPAKRAAGMARRVTKRYLPFEGRYTCHSVACAELEEKECGDRILLPPSALREVQRLKLPFPLLFLARNYRDVLRRPSGATAVRCSVLEFTAPDGVAYVPYWIMARLGLREGGQVCLKTTGMPQKGTFARFRPLDSRFFDLLGLLGPRDFMERCMKFYSVLSEGTTISVDAAGRRFELVVEELRPAKTVCLLGRVDLEVEFAPPEGADDADPGFPARCTGEDGGAGGVPETTSSTETSPRRLAPPPRQRGVTSPRSRPTAPMRRMGVARTTRGKYGTRKRQAGAFHGEGRAVDGTAAAAAAAAPRAATRKPGGGRVLRTGGFQGAVSPHRGAGGANGTAAAPFFGEGRALGRGGEAFPAAPWAQRYARAAEGRRAEPGEGKHEAAAAQRCPVAEAPARRSETAPPSAEESSPYAVDAFGGFDDDEDGDPDLALLREAQRRSAEAAAFQDHARRVNEALRRKLAGHNAEPRTTKAQRDEEIFALAAARLRGDAAGGAAEDPWACRRCTFMNACARPLCEMCSEPRGRNRERSPEGAVHRVRLKPSRCVVPAETKAGVVERLRAEVKSGRLRGRSSDAGVARWTADAVIVSSSPPWGARGRAAPAAVSTRGAGS